MWWLWILLGLLLLLIVAVICIPVVLTFRFDDSPINGEVWLRYAFFKRQLLPKQNKEKTKRKPKKIKQGKKPKNPVASIIQEHGPVDAVVLMVETAGTLVNTAKKLLTGAKIRHFKGVFRIGGQDAAEAAIHYGEVCAILYPFLGMVGSLMTFVKPDLQVSCDYDSQESDIHVSGEIHVSPLRLPIAAIWAFRYLINQNLVKGGQKYE